MPLGERLLDARLLVERPLQRAVKFVLVDRGGPERPSDEIAIAVSSGRAVASLGVGQPRHQHGGA
jgi:hypothetical protein